MIEILEGSEKREPRISENLLDPLALAEEEPYVGAHTKVLLKMRAVCYTELSRLVLRYVRLASAVPRAGSSKDSFVKHDILSSIARHSCFMD